MIKTILKLIVLIVFIVIVYYAYKIYGGGNYYTYAEKYIGDNMITINEKKEHFQEEFELESSVISSKTLNITEEYPFVLDLNETYENNKWYKIHIKENISDIEFNILRDYVFVYDDFEVRFSKLGEPLKDYSFEEEELVISNISEQDVTIVSFNEKYWLYFKYNDVNFELRTESHDEDKLIEVMNLILESSF